MWFLRCLLRDQVISKPACTVVQIPSPEKKQARVVAITADEGYRTASIPGEFREVRRRFRLV
jgi:hypothetical protein